MSAGLFGNYFKRNRDEQQPPAARRQGAGAKNAAGHLPKAPPLGQWLKDEVVAALLREGVVDGAQVREAHQRYAHTGAAPWRNLTRVPGAPHETIFSKAAQVQGFQAARIDQETTAEFVGTMLKLFPPKIGAALFELGLLPIGLEEDLIIATHDPSRPEVEQLAGKLGFPVELRYAPAAAVAQCIAAVQHALEAELVEAAPRAQGGEAEPPTNPAQPFSHEDLEASFNPGHPPEAGWAAEDQIEPASPPASGDGYAGGEPQATSKPDRAASPDPEDIKTRDRVVLMLMRKEIVTPQQVHEAKQKQEHVKAALWRILAGVEGVDRETVYAEAARVYAFPVAKMGEGKPNPDFVRSVVDTLAEENREKLMELRVLPFECEMDHRTGAVKLIFITHDPTRPEVHRLMQELKLERFELHYAPETIVRAAMIEAFPRKNEFLERMGEGGGLAFDLGAAYEEDRSGLLDENALEAEISRSTLINLFEATLVEAVRQGASDIHIWPNAQKKTEIHFRVDGRLSCWHTEEKVHPEALMAVIKDNSTNVDRFEREAAQDGFIQRWIDEALIRFRVSILPIANAAEGLRSESIVIRVLDDRKVITDLERLGLLEQALERFEMAIRQPHGMVILTGPTGSGKSTTLVAALHQVVTPEVNVLTVEDPVEYIIPGVRQIKLNHKLDLEGALRAILRHDPDVVMVGEMRDRQTAELAIKLANTGHLTFSTLHTNDAPAAVSRLYKMGIEPFLIAYAINLVVAQRLIRALCPACKRRDGDPDPVLLNRLGFTEAEVAETAFYLPGEAATCKTCKTCKGVGYKGRRAITETLYFSRAIRHLIVEAEGTIDEGAIRKLAVQEGMLSLQDSARQVVLRGETSVMEMIRVTTTEG